MTTIEQIRDALRTDAKSSETTYWNALGVIASDSSSKAAKDAALRDAAQAANEIGGVDAEQIDDDVQLLRQRAAQPDFDAMQREADTEARQLITEAAQLDADAAAARTRADALVKDAEANRSRATHARNIVNEAKQAARKLQRQLADRGCPVALIEQAVEEQQAQLGRANAEVNRAEQELAECRKQFDAAKGDKSRRSFGQPSYDPLANSVERAERELQRAKRTRDELAERIEVEATPTVVEPETREERTARHAKTEAKLGKRRSGARS